MGDETGVESVDEDREESLGEPAASRPHLGDAVLVGTRRHQMPHLCYGLPGNAGRRHRSREGRAAAADVPACAAALPFGSLLALLGAIGRRRRRWRRWKRRALGRRLEALGECVEA